MLPYLERGSYSSNQITVKSLVAPYSNMTGVLMKRKKSDRETHRGKMIEDLWRRQLSISQGEKTRTDPSLTDLRRNCLDSGLLRHQN